MTSRTVRHDFTPRTKNRLVRRNYGNNHGYTIDGRKAPGVTTILGLGLAIKFDIPSSWASRICADWVINRRDLLADERFGNTDLHSMIRNAPRNQTSDAAAKGTTVHAYAETLHTTGEVELPEEHQHLAGHITHLADLLDRWQIEAVHSEIPLAHIGQHWAGTSDLTARSPLIVDLLNQWTANTDADPLPEDALGLLDIKSGNSIRDKDRLQVVAYSNAEICQIDGVEQPMPKVHWAGLIHVQADYAHLHLVKPSYWDDCWSLFQTAHTEWKALNDDNGWLQHATDNVDQPTIAAEEAA